MLTAERARELLRYDPNTGHLSWKEQRRGAIPPGQPIRTLSHGYVVVCVDYQRCLAHRLIWLMVHGRWPERQIDHINGNRSDNRIANLREATALQNLRNSAKRKNNTSGYKGVSFEKRTKKWIARIKLDAKRLHIGSFDTPEEAHLAYCAAAATHFGEHFCDGTREHERA